MLRSSITANVLRLGEGCDFETQKIQLTTK